MASPTENSRGWLAFSPPLLPASSSVLSILPTPFPGTLSVPPRPQSLVAGIFTDRSRTNWGIGPEHQNHDTLYPPPPMHTIEELLPSNSSVRHFLDNNRYSRAQPTVADTISDRRAWGELNMRLEQASRQHSSQSLLQSLPLDSCLGFAP